MNSDPSISPAAMFGERATNLATVGECIDLTTYNEVTSSMIAEL